jgi:hypothetical protein
MFRMTLLDHGLEDGSGPGDSGGLMFIIAEVSVSASGITI